jgi:glycosyltransferase involved in cell wall biosynthesis
VVSPHGSLIIGYNPRKFVKKWLYLYGLEGRNYHQAAAVHFTTELERQQSDALGHQAPGFIVPNGIDTAEFDSFPPKEPARKELGLPSRALLVLYFGRLEPRKALDILIGAFARAMATRPMPAYLVLAGPDFGVQGSLQELSLRLGVADRVLFPGYIPPHQRNTLLAAVVLMALVSHPGENFGISALEGMLAGLPVLLSDNVGFYRDVLSDKAGLAVPVKVEAVAQALVQMLSDPDTLTGMGKAAMASARRRYDLKVVAQQMARAYEDILSGQHSVSLSWSGVKG